MIGKTRSGSFRETISGHWKSVFSNKEKVEEFWALKDVSFDVKRGEVLGVIGRNGAGKSTLLKILSRITEPTTGRVELNGRVASLLEVGTGFHPELTGRENIFLNGALLGMSRKEIKSKFDEIVDFSGVEQFIDTPVKKYSSGMYVRLAFAVAAHLESEILLVDEVLAVGDMEFQKKSTKKIHSIVSQGRTIIIISHNHNFIQTVCNKAIILKNGTLTDIGNPDKLSEKYSNFYMDRKSPHLYSQNYEIYNKCVKIQDILYKNNIVSIRLESKKLIKGIGIVLLISNTKGEVIFKTSTSPIWSNSTFDIINTELFTVDLSQLNLISGKYYIGLAITKPNVKTLLHIQHALSINIICKIKYNGSKKLVAGKDGYVMAKHKWNHIKIQKN